MPDKVIELGALVSDEHSIKPTSLTRSALRMRHVV